MNKLWIALLLLLSGCNGGSGHAALIVGDSISLGIMPYVQQELPDWYIVHNPGVVGENGRSSDVARAHLKDWLAQVGPVDVIHANWGLWDMSRGKFGDTKNSWRDCSMNRDPHTSIAEYRDNLEAIATIMEKTGSRIVWATTTPVPDGNPCVLASDVPKYNSVLVEVAGEHGFAVDDLYSYVAPYAATLHKPATGVHFTDEGYQFLSYKVAQELML